MRGEGGNEGESESEAGRGRGEGGTPLLTCPASGTREVLSRILLRGPEVADDGAVGSTHIAGGAVEVPGAPGGVGLEGNLATPVAVLRVRHARSERKAKDGQFKLTLLPQWQF